MEVCILVKTGRPGEREETKEKIENIPVAEELEVDVVVVDGKYDLMVFIEGSQENIKALSTRIKAIPTVRTTEALTAVE